MIVVAFFFIVVHAISAFLLKWMIDFSPPVENKKSAWPFALYIQGASVFAEVLLANMPASLLGLVFVFTALAVNWFAACHGMLKMPWWYSLVLGAGYILIWLFCVMVLSALFVRALSN